MEKSEQKGMLTHEKQLSANEDFQLLCCGGSREVIIHKTADKKEWLTAAELVYTLSKQSGTVTDDLIIFDSVFNQKIEISLLKGYFFIYEKGAKEPIKTGRKALELLMALENVNFEAAVKWLNDNFNSTLAENLATDYLKMLIDSFKQ